MTKNLQKICKVLALILIAENCLPSREGREYEASDITTSHEDKHALGPWGIFTGLADISSHARHVTFASMVDCVSLVRDSGLQGNWLCPLQSSLS